MGTTGESSAPGLPPRRPKTVGPDDAPCPFGHVATSEYSESTVRQLVDDSGLRSIAEGLGTRVSPSYFDRSPGSASPDDPTVATPTTEASHDDTTVAAPDLSAMSAEDDGGDPVTDVDADQVVTAKQPLQDEVSARSLPHLGTRRTGSVVVADELGLSTAVFPTDAGQALPEPVSQWPQASQPETLDPALDAPTDAPTLPRPPAASRAFRTERLVVGRLYRQTLLATSGLVALALLLFVMRVLASPGAEAMALVLMPAVGVGAAIFLTCGLGWIRTPRPIAVPIVASCATLFYGLGVFLVGWAAQAPTTGSSIRAALTQRLAWLTDIEGGLLTTWWLATVLGVAVLAGLLAHRLVPDSQTPEANGHS